MKIDPTARAVARQIYRRKNPKRTTFRSSPKATGVVQLESGLEADFARIADLDPRVLTWAPQPYSVDLDTGTVATNAKILKQQLPKAKIYTPDFIIGINDGRRISVETKADWLVRNDPNRLQQILNAYAHLSRPLLLLDENAIPKTLADNAFLTRISHQGLVHRGG